MKKQFTKIAFIGVLLILIIMIFFNRQEVQSENHVKQKKDIKKEATFIYEKNVKISSVQCSEKKEYETMPSNLKGHRVIGKLDIPSINLTTYILEETTDETLNISVTKLEGPEINNAGNLCIVGHNYPNSKMFFKLNKVKKDDEIILTDTFDESVKYRVYEIKEILPQELDILSQDTGEEKEVTLITCTFGAIKRIVVKAVEIYD